MLKQDRTGLRAERSETDAVPEGAGTVAHMGADEMVDRVGAASGDADEGSDYVPEGIEIPEERRQELLEEAKRHSARLIAKLGEPSAQAMARAERLWNEIHSSDGATIGVRWPDGTQKTPGS